jgi:hypothetical protein
MRRNSSSPVTGARGSATTTAPGSYVRMTASMSPRLNAPVISSIVESTAFFASMALLLARLAAVDGGDRWTGAEGEV